RASTTISSSCSIRLPINRSVTFTVDPSLTITTPAAGEPTRTWNPSFVLTCSTMLLPHPYRPTGRKHAPSGHDERWVPGPLGGTMTDTGRIAQPPPFPDRPLPPYISHHEPIPAYLDRMPVLDRCCRRPRRHIRRRRPAHARRAHVRAGERAPQHRRTVRRCHLRRG